MEAHQEGLERENFRHRRWPWISAHEEIFALNYQWSRIEAIVGGKGPRLTN